MLHGNGDYEGLVGKSLLKSAKALTTFQDLLDLSFKNPFSVFELNHTDKDWENIPFIVPQSIITLEKRIQSLQSWGQIKEDEIQQLKKNVSAALENKEQTNQLKRMQDDIGTIHKKEAEMQKGFEWRIAQIEQLFQLQNKQEIKIKPPKHYDHSKNEEEHANKNTGNANKNDSISQKASNIVTQEAMSAVIRKVSSRTSQKDRDTLSHFFTKLTHMEEHETKAHEEFTSSLIEDDEFNTLRKFNIKQIRYLFFQYLNRSALRDKVEALDARIKSMEGGSGKMDNIQKSFFGYVDEQVERLEKVVETTTHRLDTLIEEKVIKAIEMSKKKISDTHDSIEDMRGELRDTKSAQNSLTSKLEKVALNVKGYSSHFENRFSKFEVRY